jgi:hypothetical protein
MTVPQQLSQIPILRTRYPDLRKVIFPHQSQQESGVLTVGLPLLHSLRLDRCVYVFALDRQRVENFACCGEFFRQFLGSLKRDRSLNFRNVRYGRLRQLEFLQVLLESGLRINVGKLLRYVTENTVPKYVR